MVAQELAVARVVAAQLGVHRSDSLLQGVEGHLGSLKPLLVLLRVGIRLDQLLLEILQDSLALHVLDAAAALVPRNLGPELGRLLLELLLILVELVDEVEEREVLVLGGDERRHQVVDVRHAGGFLNLLESLLVQRQLRRALLRLHRPVALGGVHTRLLLPFRERQTELGSLELVAHVRLLHLLVVLDDAPEFAPLRVKLRSLPVALRAQRRDLVVRLVPGLVRDVGDLHDVGHLPLLLRELLVHLLVHLVKREPLAAQDVDLVAQLLVVGDGLVEVHQRLVELVLEDPDLLYELLVVLLRGAHASHCLLLLDDRGFREREVLVELLHAAPLHLDLPGVEVGKVGQTNDFGVDVGRGQRARRVELGGELALEGVVLLLELVDDRALALYVDLRVLGVRASVGLHDLILALELHERHLRVGGILRTDGVRPRLASVGDEMRGRGQIISFTGRARGTGRARAGFERGVVGAYLVPHHGGTPGVETSADGVSRVRSPALLALVRWAIQNRDLRVTRRQARADFPRQSKPI